MEVGKTKASLVLKMPRNDYFLLRLPQGATANGGTIGRKRWAILLKFTFLTEWQYLVIFYGHFSMFYGAIKLLLDILFSLAFITIQCIFIMTFYNFLHIVPFLLVKLIDGCSSYVYRLQMFNIARVICSGENLCFVSVQIWWAKICIYFIDHLERWTIQLYVVKRLTKWSMC
jgi:hypothetical protein